MAKGNSKRAYHKKDMAKVNRTALIIGGAAAGLILILIVISFVR
ncbi:MAG: DUF2970 domain-containing protein [Veillonellaceae bacterium]|jgi:hypothetical protein|nr:DUF2970 domain-containing protein [Veillonellaceae bacterium]